MPRHTSGSVTSRNDRSPLAPTLAAASSIGRWTRSSEAYEPRTVSREPALEAGRRLVKGPDVGGADRGTGDREDERVQPVEDVAAGDPGARELSIGAWAAAVPTAPSAITIASPIVPNPRLSLSLYLSLYMVGGWSRPVA